MSVVVVIVICVAALGYWRYDVWRRPHVPCRICKGSGADFSKLSATAFGKCWCCKGAKAHARFLGRFLAPSVYRAIKDGKSGRNNWGSS